MANTYTTLSGLFTAIANAIRAKNGSTAVIVADNFPTEIESLKSGFDYNNHNVVAIPDYAFYGCADLNNVNCYNLTSVGAGAFENCKNLKTIILYDGVESVGENAFKGCEGLTIYCATESKPDTWDENWNPDNCEVIWGFAPVEAWDISATESDAVTAKLYNDIQNDGMHMLFISGSGDMKDYTYSGDTAVPWISYRANIISAVINDNVTSIGDSAFDGCEALTSVTIPNSVTSIGISAFGNCTGLTSVTIPNSVTIIGDYAFSGCKALTSVIIPDSVTIIVGHAFNGCTGLTSITIPDSVTHIGNATFRGCSGLTSVVIGNGVTSIRNATFNGCKALTSVIIGNSVTSIGDNAFWGCSALTSITIPDSVVEIVDNAFRNCKSLMSITIPNSVTWIGDNVFQDCINLESIVYIGTVAQWSAIEFGGGYFDNNNTGNYTIHCTDGDIAKDGTITYHNT